MVYLKAVQKSTPIAVSVSGTIDQKTYLKNLGGGFSPLSPTPGSAYGFNEISQKTALSKSCFKKNKAIVKSHKVAHNFV